MQGGGPGSVLAGQSPSTDARDVGASARRAAQAVPMPTSPDDRRRVTTVAQLRRAGWTHARIRAQLDAGRWQRVGHAIAMHNGPLTRQQRWQVARLHAGRHALFTAFTAAEYYGLRGWERNEVHLLVPRGARVLTISPVPIAAHRVRDWADVRRVPDAPVHVRHAALLVAAGSLPHPRQACGLLAAAVQQRVASPAGLTRALDGASRVRHRRDLLAAVHDIGQGSQALSEIDFVRLCRRFGLPPPEQQTVRREPDGRRRYLDATWRRTDGRLVVVEIDGALHLDQRRWWDDQARQNELALGDALVLRFPSVVVRTHPELVARQLRRALGL